MAKKRDWLTIFIVLLLVSSIVGHYVGDVVVEAGTKITPRLARKLAEEGLKELLVSDEDMFGMYVADELVDEV